MPYLYKIKQNKLYERFMPVFGLTLAIVLVYGLCQFVLGPNRIDAYWMATAEFNSLGLPLPFSIKPFSILSSPGSYSVFLLIACVLLGNNYYRMPKKNTGLLGFYLVIPLIILTQITTGVRSSLLITLCIILGLLIKGIFTRRTHFKTIFGISFFVVIALQLFPMIQIEDLQNLQTRLTEIDSNDISYLQRIKQLIIALNQIANNPFGFGLGSSGRFSENVILIENGYVELLYQIGIIPGSIILLLLVSLLLKKHNLRNHIGYQSYFILPIFGKILLLSLLLIMFFTHILQQPLGWLAVFFYAISNLNLKNYENCNPNKISS
jgi:hypothetical protein